MSSINRHNTHILPVEFQYHQPETVEEAVKLLGAHPDAKPIAGGTDLVPKMKQRLLEPGHLVNV
jgi:CO/xanthine dehydrogenase FAD-binding subunit